MTQYFLLILYNFKNMGIWAPPPLPTPRSLKMQTWTINRKNIRCDSTLLGKIYSRLRSNDVGVMFIQENRCVIYGWGGGGEGREGGYFLVKG